MLCLTHKISDRLNHGRIEHRRCYAFDQLDSLHRPERWPGLKSFAVIESSRAIKGKITTERRFYISSLPPDASHLATAIREHWHIENRLHWCMDVIFADDPMRARTHYAAHNLAVLKQLTLNLIRLNPAPRKDGIKVQRLIASTSDSFRSQLLALIERYDNGIHAIALALMAILISNEVQRTSAMNGHDGKRHSRGEAVVRELPLALRAGGQALQCPFAKKNGERGRLARIVGLN
jgi:predicted transposase YbfD/YdcC